VKVSDFAGYRAAAAKLSDLQKQLNQAERDAGKLEGCDSKQVPVADRDAMEILAGKTLPATTEDSPSARAWRKVYALRRACELQKQELGRERQNASEKICVDERPRYEKILQAQAQAVEALVKAHKAEAEFREQLMHDDVSFTHWIPPCGFRMDLDIPADVEVWRKEAREHKYKI
jgi:hypothetical protein